jgi:prostaglandin-endoperoxide synthase 2
MASIVSPRLLGRLIKIGFKIPFPPLHRLLNRIAINKFAKATPPRPRPLSMAAPYTTWRGLTDRRYTGRHLPPAPDYTRGLPDAEKVLKLFERKGDRRATDTSLLFPFFAQWFTDSFLRTKWKEPEEQDFAENESNHEIDLCQIYGIGEGQTTMLRAGSGGRLKTQPLDGEEFPVPLFEDNGQGPKLRSEFEGLYSQSNFDRVFAGASDAHKMNCFAVGLEHGNSTMGNTLMNILFLREHNRIAGVLVAAHPDWLDERLFQTARNVNIVLLLKIVVGDYIEHIAPEGLKLMVVPGAAEDERWYRTNWIAVEFALLYRWHDLIPETVRFADEERDSVELRRNNAWLRQVGVDRMCLDASRQLAGRIGLHNNPDFLKKVKAISLRMARACELAPYNEYRKYYELDPVPSFQALTGDEATAKELGDVYNDIDKLEWFVGIFAEDYREAEIMGELMFTMVGNDAFTQALTNPLLAERVYNADTFSAEGLAIIDGTETLADVVVRNSGITDPEQVGFKILN